MKLYKRIYFICFSLFLAVGCSEPSVEKEVLRPVRYEAVKQFSSQIQRSFSGVSESGTDAQLSFRVSGIIRKIHVELGQRVKKGDPIAVMDSADAALDYDKAVAATKNARVQMETARSGLDRIRGLYENNNVALNEYESAKNKFAAANSDYSAAKKNMALRQRELTYYQLNAPMDGVVVSKEVNENENISSGQAIVSISSEADIQVVVGVPEKYISQVKKDISVSIIFSTLPGKLFQGVISQISYSISAAGTYPVKIDLNRMDDAIRPGMPANVSFFFNQGNQDRFLVVPANAVGQDTSGKFIFTVVPGKEEGTGIVHKKLVDIGQLTDKGFQILSGVREGEFVITSGINKMTQDKQVKFLE